jgi:hypothetical protein
MMKKAEIAHLLRKRAPLQFWVHHQYCRMIADNQGCVTEINFLYKIKLSFQIYSSPYFHYHS